MEDASLSELRLQLLHTRFLGHRLKQSPLEQRFVLPDNLAAL
jgi:hypothetical protein